MCVAVLLLAAAGCEDDDDDPRIVVVNETDETITAWNAGSSGRTITVEPDSHGTLPYREHERATQFGTTAMIPVIRVRQGEKQRSFDLGVDFYDSARDEYVLEITDRDF